MAVTRLACPSCGIAVPVQGPVAPQQQVTCPECRAAFPASQGMMPGTKSSSGSSGGGMIVAIILCVVVGFGALAALSAAAIAIGVVYLSAKSNPAPVAQAQGPVDMPDLNQPPRAGSKIGQTAPEIVGTDIDGKPMKLSDYKGKVVVLDFWGHW